MTDSAQLTRRMALKGALASAVSAALYPRGALARRGFGAIMSGGGVGAGPILLYASHTAVPVGTYPANASLWPPKLPNGSAVTSSNVADLYGGENHHGGFLSLFGIFPGATTNNLGTTTKVLIGGAEPIYLYAGNAVTTLNNTNFVVQRIDVQVGSAAIQALALGMPVSVVVQIGGVSSSSTDLFGNPITFTPIQAPIFYIDETNGSDANAGTFASPLQHAQTYNGSTWSGACVQNTYLSGGVAYTSSTSGLPGVQAGTHFVFRGGQYAYASSLNNTYLNLFQITGCSPTATPTGGAQGVNAGPLTFTARPTLLGPEIASFSPGGNTGEGFIYGADDVRAGSANPYDSSITGTGYAHYIEIANITVAIPTTSTSTGSSPIYMAASSDWWRVTNCDLSANVSSPPDIKGGGVQGDGHGVYIVGNYIHDITCNSAYENHGIYLDSGTEYSSNCVVAFNCLNNCLGGSGIQFYGVQFTNPSKSISAISWAAGTITVTSAANFSTFSNLTTGRTFTTVIAGVTPSAYNGKVFATVTGPNTFTYALANNPGAATVLGTYTGTDKWGCSGHSGNIVAYNWINNVQKYGVNHADSSESAQTYCNIIQNTNSYAIRLNALNVPNGAFSFANNTVYNGCMGGSGSNAMFSDDGNVAGGYVEFHNNAFVLGASGSGRTSTATKYFARSGATGTSIYTWTDNQFYDPQGFQTSPPTFGTVVGSVYGDPKFTTEFTVFTLASGSPCIGTGTTDSNIGTAVTRDFAMNPMPRSGQSSPSRGAYA